MADLFNNSNNNNNININNNNLSCELCPFSNGALKKTENGGLILNLFIIISFFKNCQNIFYFINGIFPLIIHQ